MTSLNTIQQFFEPRKFAMVGASRNEKKSGGAFFKELTSKGFEVIPVNPNAETIQAIKCYPTVMDLPDDVQHVYLLTPKKVTGIIVGDLVKKGVKMVWIQQGSHTPEAVELLEKAGITVIHKKCILMFAEPVNSIHKFHRSFVKFFGGYPRLMNAPAN